MSQTIDTAHGDMVHDVQMDYYGKRLATCSSDRTIKIFEVTKDGHKLSADLKGHEGPVWQVCWAHPKFTTILASCSYDRKVFVWKETSANTWTKLYEYSDHESSVNSICFAPHEFGLILFCASSDNYVSVLTHRPDDDGWDTKKFEAHQLGVNAIACAPATTPTSLLLQPNQQQQQQQQQQHHQSQQDGLALKRFVTGGCDNLVKIWRWDDQTNKWLLEHTLDGHSDWVRDVAWAPNLGICMNTIASCSQDGMVIIWTQESDSSSSSYQWKKTILPTTQQQKQGKGCIAWRVSWSLTGNILAVSTSENKVSLWKEAIDGTWKQISTVSSENNQQEFTE